MDSATRMETPEAQPGILPDAAESGPADPALSLREVSGIILAGGKSSRFGRNKALATLGGRTIIEDLALRFRRAFEEVIIVASDPSPYENLGVKVARDRVPGKGPLGGIHAGLAAAAYPRSFCLACDMPFVSLELAAYMASLAPEADAVVPRIGDHYEPMHAVYVKTCLPAIERQLSAPDVKIIAFYSAVRVRVVSEGEVRRFGYPARIFFNINTVSDYGRAEEMIAERG